ncbi:MAG: non-hydrolyzing UDP-N-acetylglucosamine 2-epimerase [Flavobacteriales bacterium]
MKIVTIIGARPQIIKAAAISRAIANNYSHINEVLVHTGQHYDENMSEVFFNELGIPRIDYNLQVGSGQHGKQTAKMIDGIEEILLSEKPSALLVYGDTNSTLAGAIAAAKLHVPVVHVESGLRSFNKTMPEEINRIMCDHASSILFTPTQTGLLNLKNEGFDTAYTGRADANNPRVYLCGDVMYDNSLYFSDLSDEKSVLLKALNLNLGDFILSTIHRDNNTDNPQRLNAIFSALLAIIEESGKKIVLPLHPRTKKMLPRVLDSQLFKLIQNHSQLIIIPPVSFLDVIALEKTAQLVITDSGGVQKEAFFFKKPCLILRPETEWIELVNNGNAIIVDADESKIITGYRALSSKTDFSFPEFYGDGHAAEFICERMIEHLV